MLTVVETPLFRKQWPHYWDEEERGDGAREAAEEGHHGRDSLGHRGLASVTV